MSDSESSSSESGVDEPLVTKKFTEKGISALNTGVQKLKQRLSLNINGDDKENSQNGDRMQGIEEDIMDPATQEQVNDNGNDAESVNKILQKSRNSVAEDKSRRNSNILDSAEVKDLDWAKRCLETGSSPEATCKRVNMSVCHIASFYGEYGILREILRRNPSLYKRADASGRTPLHFAVWEGHVDSLAILLGLNPGELTLNKPKSVKDKKEVVHMTVKQDILRWINAVEGEKPIIHKDDLCDASHSCDNVTRILDVVWRSCSPLHVACARVQLECALALLACGADITVHDEHGRTPLDVCGLAAKEAETISEVSSKSFVKIIEGIIRYGKNNDVNRNLWLTNQHKKASPLHIAVLLGSKKATKMLLDIRALPDLLDETGQTPLHLAVKNKKTSILQALANSTYIRRNNQIDVINENEHTPLQYAVLEKWLDGITILLDANASIINQSNSNRDSALHFAAEVGDADVIEKLVNNIQNKLDWIDCRNASEETPLFTAIRHGNATAVRCFLHEGASYTTALKGSTVLHKAIDSDNKEILQTILETENIDELLNIVDEDEGMTPLHWAAKNNKSEYVLMLINKGANKYLKTKYTGYTALHIAAMEGNADAVKVILDKDEDKTLMNTTDNKDQLPFYSAVKHCHRECIELFLKHGSNLAQVVVEDGKKVLIMTLIKNNMPRCKDCLDNIFNNQITTNDHTLDHPKCEVVFDYSIIIPDNGEKNFKQMQAFHSLFSSANNLEINKLILNPYIETFLLLKWKILMKFFLMVLGIYGIFVVLLTDITIHMYGEVYKTWSNPLFFHIKKILLICLVAVIMFMEILFMRLKGIKYFKRTEGWIKTFSVMMALVVVILDYMQDHHERYTRIIVALALLLSWIEITILLSQFPTFGYYFQMFSTVALRVCKVFMLFGSFVIVGFSLIFWILIKKDQSFMSPWSSLVKTLVMMTSEFDYSSLVEEGNDNEDNIDNNRVDDVVVQLFFIIFLVCVPIVFMNLLLALAVSDVKDLEIEGKIERLIEQVEFLANLEVLSWNLHTTLSKMNLAFGSKFKVDKEIKIYPGKPYWDFHNHLPRHLMESISQNLNDRKISDEKEKQTKLMLQKLEENIERVKEHEISNSIRHEELIEMIEKLAENIKNQKPPDTPRNRWARLLDLAQ